ncbi:MULTISPECIES: hypothetical protein [unclassified Lysinibacillus]|uniref:hypothetical protein n=1 Tax=unclassified Lysinibacillus TaxID=2636778 RepID=UPI00380B4AFB
MLSTKFVSNCLQDNVQDIKLSSLYFDKVEIVEDYLYNVEPVDPNQPLHEGGIGTVVDIHEFVKSDFKEELKLFETEQIITYTSTEHKKEDEIWNKVNESTMKFLNENLDLIFHLEKINEREGRIGFSDKEVEDVIENLINPIGVGAKIDTGFLFKYYSSLFSNLIYSNSLGDSCITTSNVLHNIVSRYNQTESIIKPVNVQKQAPPALVYEAVKLALPDVSHLSIEDILEVRYQLRDELQSFRFEMDKMHFDLLNDFEKNEIEYHANEIVKFRIKPTIDELQSKASGSKLTLLNNLVKEIKDPSSYVPFVGTIFGHIPAHIATLISAGLIGTTTYLDYLNQVKEYKNNGLYYLLKLNKYSKNS